MEPNQKKQTSKQYITRDTEIKNKLTVTGGEMEGDKWGEKGEGFTGTSIKDTWTKTSVVKTGEGGANYWGGAEGWGDKAENCT